MPYKDKSKQKAYQREYQCLRRAGQSIGNRGIEVIHAVKLEQTRTAQGLLHILAGLIKEVLETKEVDVFMRSRTAGYLISIGLRAVEVADLESRVSNLEKVMGGQK
jgi:hypothetical protein